MKFFIKRMIDIVLSIIGLIVLLPFWIFISVLIKLNSRGPVFYTHVRIGQGRKEFNCFKFRSMYVSSDQNQLVSDPDDKRVTRIGNLLRKTSMDETPQLINVFLGHMSMVGPRPALPTQVENFSKTDFDKLLVKPGLTGWTQVNGRNSIPYSKRLELDCWYAKNWNLLLDLKILFKTIFVLYKRDGIYDAK